MPEREQHLARLTWPEVAGAGASRVLVVPVGSTEQHGPHLPLGTDSVVAEALAAALAGSCPWATIAPVLAFGSSGEHAGFPGTLSVGQRVLTDAVVELVRSSRGAFGGVVVVSAHGGNADALAKAERRCTADGDRVLVWSPRVPGGDAHAGRTETSLMLALEPESVRLDQAVAGPADSLAALMPALRSDGVRAVSPEGVLGDPTGASAAEGRALLAAMVEDLSAAVTRWRAAVLDAGGVSAMSGGTR